MSRGRPPKTEKAKKLAGNPGKRKPKAAPARPPVPAVKGRFAVSPPEWLDLEGRTKWFEVAPSLEAFGHPLEPDILAAYCQAWSEFRQATDMLNTDGRVHYTDKEYPVQHPAVAQQRTAIEALKKLSRLLGLDGRRPPAPPPAEPVADEFEQFLGKK